MYQATKDTSKLTKATGYWSGETVYFNTDPDKVIIIDQELRTKDLPKIIHKHLKAYLELDLVQFFKARHNPEEETFPEYIAGRNSGSSLRKYFNINKFSIINKLDLKMNNTGQLGWGSISEWITERNKTETEQKQALSKLLTIELLANPSASKHYVRAASLMCLFHPWLRNTLNAFAANNSPTEEALTILAKVAYCEEFTLGRHRLKANEFNKVTATTLSTLSRKGVAIPKIDGAADMNRLGNFVTACSVFMGLLALNKHILLPGHLDVSKSFSLHPIYKRWMESLSLPKAGKKSLAARILAFSTIRTISDIPENISELTSILPSSTILNSTFYQPLVDYAENNKLSPFPLKGLHRNKGRRGKNAVKYSIEWMKENNIPGGWILFAERLLEASDNGVEVFISQIRATMEWAWFRNGFSSPSQIRRNHIRDPHQPESTTTLFHHISNSGVQRKWDRWNQIERAFSLVFNIEKLSSVSPPLITENPFESISNPFRGKRSNTTYRHRIPTNVHEAMLHVLLSPDDNDNPTYSFVKEELNWDWFNWINPATNKAERRWCPSRTNCLLFALMLPPRFKQARWVDQGLLDQMIWDIDSQSYIKNMHKLRDWQHPKTGKTHFEIYGRPSGVLQPTHDDWYSSEQRCIYINTNKTKMWDPEGKTGHEIWWPQGNMLREIDTANLTKQANFLDRPYNLIEAQIRWVQEHDPNPEPITFSDSSYDAGCVNKRLKDHYPHFVPIFRDLSSIYHRDDGTKYYLPPTPGKLKYLFYALAYHTEILLREQGLDVAITEPSQTSNNYKGRKCRHNLHSLRVYGISYLMEIGVPWPIVQMIVGHAAPAMTLYYNKPSPEHIRDILTEKISGANILSDWEEIGEDILKSQKEFIATNSGFSKKFIPDDLLNQNYAGFTQKPGGMCPLGGTGCETGQVVEQISTTNNKTKSHYGPVEGGCGNCRFFCTTPAHLFQHQMVINDLFIQIRSFGKKQTALAQKLSDLRWENTCDSQSISSLKSQIEDNERQIEPMIREWMNRTQMAMQTVEQLDEYIKFLNDRKHEGSKMILLSAATAEDLLPEISVRMEQTGEFELARQTLLAGHLQGGIDQCSELSRKQVNLFMDQIMIHDDPQHLLLHISDEKTRDQVAFLMAEAMSAIAGSDTVQKALDEGKGLKASGLPESEHKHLKELIHTLFSNAKLQGRKATMSSLLPPGLQSTNYDKENIDEH
jgi:hypothetical protein